MSSFTAGLIVACLISLFATVTNFVPVSVLGPAACLIIFLVSVWHGAFKSDVSRWATIFFAYSAINCLIYSPESFLNPEFYRYDGNMFLSFAPYLLVGLFATHYDIDRLMFRFLLFATAICLPVVAYDIGRGQIPSHGLFIAHNAFGGFLMFTTSIALAYAYHRRSLASLLLAGAQLSLLALSFSRGSLLGVIGAVIAFWCFRRGRMWPLWASIAAIIVAQTALLSWSYPIYVSTPNAVRDLLAEGYTSQEANVLIRAMGDWPRGVDLFLHSPIFGMGFGSFNDWPSLLPDFALVQFKQATLYRYTPGHAHHSYIHWLGEVGLVGLVLFLAFWSRVHKMILAPTVNPMTRDAIYMGFWAITFAAFTEHRLPTPSNAFPLALSVLLYAASVRGAQIRADLVARHDGDEAASDSKATDQPAEGAPGG